MTTCWPQFFESCSPTMRPITSVGPPAAKGTMMRTTRVGHAAARARTVVTLGTSRAADAVALNCRRVIITISLIVTGALHAVAKADAGTAGASVSQSAENVRSPVSIKRDLGGLGEVAPLHNLLRD